MYTTKCADLLLSFDLPLPGVLLVSRYDFSDPFDESLDLASSQMVPGEGLLEQLEVVVACHSNYYEEEGVVVFL